MVNSSLTSALRTQLMLLLLLVPLSSVADNSNDLEEAVPADQEIVAEENAEVILEVEEEPKKKRSWLSRLFSRSGNQRTYSSSRRGRRPFNRNGGSSQNLKLPEPEQINSITSQEGIDFDSEVNTKVGRIVWIDEELDIAVVELETRYININDSLLTRGQDLDITGAISPTKTKRGRSLGFDITGGNPEIGDDVIHPKSSLADMYLPKEETSNEAVTE